MLPNIASFGNDLVAPSSSKGSQSWSSDFPKDRQSSSCGPTGVGYFSSSSTPAGPHLSFGSQLGTSGNSQEDFIPD